MNDRMTYEGSWQQEIERLRAELAETKRYWEECQVEHHQRNLEVQEANKRVEELETNYNRLHGEGIALTAEVERYKSALREITGIGPSFDAKGTQSRRIDKIARRALDGEE